MWGWRISLRIWISLATRSTSLTSCIFSFSSILTATFSLVRLWFPSLTLPNVPFPIVLPIKSKKRKIHTKDIVADIFELTLRLRWIGVIWVWNSICCCRRGSRILLLLSVLWGGGCLFALRGHCGHGFRGVTPASGVGLLRVLVNWILSLVVMVVGRMGPIALDYLGRCQVRGG
jgi:hypothetical protein